MTRDEIKARILELEPRVAAHLDRGGAPRGLTPEEKRVAAEDPGAFEKIVKARQQETLDLIRDAAILDTLRDDLAKLEAAETAEQRAQMEAERQQLLESREGAAVELQAALENMGEALEDFMKLNHHIAVLDRNLGEKDRHRAGHGLVALHLKRALHQVSPTLARMAGVPFAAPRHGRTLADSFRTIDPLD